MGGEAARTASLEVLAAKVRTSSMRCSSDRWTGMGAGAARDVVYRDEMDTRRLCEWKGRRERKRPIQTETQNGEVARDGEESRTHAALALGGGDVLLARLT